MPRRVRLFSVTAAACLAAGCQPPASPEPARPTPVAIALPAPATAPSPAADPAAGPVATPQRKGELAAKMAETQIRSIDEMLAARAAKADGVTLVEPSRTVTPEAKSTPAARPPDAAVPAATPSANATGASAAAMDAAAAGVAAAAAVPPSASSPATPSGSSPAGALRPVPSIGAGAVPDAAPSNTPPNIAPNTPVTAAARTSPSESASEPLDKWIAQRAVEHPHDLAMQLDLQLLKFVHDEPVPAGDSLAGLDVEDRGLLSGLLDGLTNFRAALRASPNLLMTRKIRPLTEMADRLRGQADLSIPVAVLCRSAPGFGNYTAIEPARLQQGVDAKPVLYYEIENFTLRLDEKNFWTTSMQQDLVLYDHAGRAKWQMPRRLIRDTCRSRRHDFFMAYPVSLPTDLDPGDYTLKITLIDPAAARVAETGVRITITPNSPSAPTAADR